MLFAMIIVITAIISKLSMIRRLYAIGYTTMPKEEKKPWKNL